MTKHERIALKAEEAASTARLIAMGLDRVAAQAGHRACQESLEDSEGTCRCPRCEHRFTPDPTDFYEVGPLSRRSQGDGPRDRCIDCPGCGRKLGEFDLED